MHMQIKITIITQNLLLKKNWEVKLFQYLLNNSQVELSTIIINKKTSVTLKKDLINLINFILLTIVGFIEKKFIRMRMKTEQDYVKKNLSKKKLQFINQKNILDLNNLELLINNDSSDLIINLTNANVNNCNILKFPKFGIWNFLKNEEENHEIINDFKNFYNNLQVYKQKILINEDKFTNQLLSVNFNRFKCFYQTKEYASIKICNTLIGEINKICVNNEISKINKIIMPKKSDLASREKFNFIFSILRYFLNTYSRIIFRKCYSILSYTKKINEYKWHLAHINSDDYRFNSSELTIHYPNNDEFWADPFLFNHKNIDYVFFENYKYKDKKGIISVGEIIENKIVNVKDIIKCNYHLSYPYIFKYEDNVYMIPETHESKRLEIWISKKFPYQWELYKTVFTGIKMVDSSILKYKNEYWLFTNIEDDFYNDFTTSLCIFKIDSPLLNKIEPHRLNPVIIGTENSRNAGSIFIDKNGNFIRPSQAYSEDIYGRYINLSKIINLDLNQYKETIIEKIMPNQKDNIKGFHHINKYGNKFVIDVFMKK